MSEEVSSEVIKKTQKLLGKYVKKPPLSEKLLKKPPFRFLQDVVCTVVKETGFLKGLYTDEELKSDNVKEKEVKIAFLIKLIDAVKTLTKSELNVRSSKIVAGLEPTNTNLLLQAIGKALDGKIDSTEYVKQLKSKSTEEKTEKTSKKTDAPKDSKQRKSKVKEAPAPVKAAKQISKSTANKEETPKSKRSTPKESPRKNEKELLIKAGDKRSTPRTKEQQVTAQKVDKKRASEEKNATIEEQTTVEVPNTENTEVAAEIVKIIPSETEGPKEEEHTQENEKENPESKLVDVTSHKTNLVRPKSARPKSGDKDKTTTTKLINEKGDSLKPIEMTIKATPQRPKSSLRPPSVRPSSARPGAPRLRPDSALPLQESMVMGNINVIVENVDVGDDEEIVVIETAPDANDDDGGADTSEVLLKNKGHLVEQILEKIHEGEEVKKNVDIDWEANTLYGKEEAKELSQLRSYIQSITKTANPLGKLMNYLHEDIDAMHNELQMWTHTKKQLFAEIYRQQRLSAERDKPLLSQLQQLKQEIAKHKQGIAIAQSTILKNDARIKELINKQLNVN